MAVLTGQRFEKLGVVLDLPAGAAAHAADGAVVACARERYRLWYTALGDSGCAIRTLESASPLEWNGSPADVFPEPPPGAEHPPRVGGWRGWLQRLGSGGPACVRDPYVLYHQRLWYLWYGVTVRAEPSAADAASIWCCTSAAAERWVGHEVALEPGEDFDAVAVAEPAVVRDAERDTWLMAYAGSDGTTWRIGLAESVDLLRWSRVGMIVESWLPTVSACRTPRLIRLGDTWQLVFTAQVEGRWGVYGTTSADTVWWQTPEPLVQAELPTETDGQRAGFPLRVGADLYLYYGGCADGKWRTHAAVARDVFQATR